jgi:hypothetical protein
MTRIAALAAANDLRAVMQGKVVLLGDAAYPATRQIWNGAVDHQPALFAVCETTKDVQAAVQVADSHGLPLSVRGGGHDWAGRALRHDGVRLHRPPGLLAGLILFPWSEAEQVLHGYAKAIETAADELGVIVGVLSGPNGDPVLSLAPTWSGGPAEGERIIVGLQCLGRPLLVVTGPMAYSDLLGMYDAHVVNGRHYALQTRWVSALTPEVISTLIAGGNNRTSPFTTIALHHFNGAATRVPLHATAFGLRRKHFLVEAIAAWEPDAQIDSTTHRQWAHNLSQALAPVALAGGYPNLLGPDEYDRSVMLNRSQYAPRMIFGSWALKLLRNQRQRWDPNHAIRPDRQRFGLISCIFGLNSFLNIDRSVKQ